MFTVEQRKKEKKTNNDNNEKSTYQNSLQRTENWRASKKRKKKHTKMFQLKSRVNLRELYVCVRYFHSFYSFSIYFLPSPNDERTNRGRKNSLAAVFGRGTKKQKYLARSFKNAYTYQNGVDRTSWTNNNREGESERIKEEKRKELCWLLPKIRTFFFFLLQF